MSCEVYHRSGALMHEVDDGSATLVITGPPYFSDHLEPRLFHPSSDRIAIDQLETEVLDYAVSLTPVLAACWRVLRNGGTLVVQTRDLRVGERLLPTVSAHRCVVESLGFALYTRYLWYPKPIHPARVSQVRAENGRGYVRPHDPEEFLVFFKPSALPGYREQPPPTVATILSTPVLYTSRGHLARRHRHSAPLPVIELFVNAYSAEGDLVVDPFAGYGTTLVAAGKLGRRAIGYDISLECVERSHENCKQFADLAIVSRAEQKLDRWGGVKVDQYRM